MRGRFEHTGKISRNLSVAGYLLRPGQSTPEGIEISSGQLQWVLDKIRKGALRFYPANPIVRRESAARPAPASLSTLPYLPPRIAAPPPARPAKIEKVAEVIKPKTKEIAPVVEEQKGYSVFYPELPQTPKEPEVEVPIMVERITESKEGLVKYSTEPEPEKEEEEEPAFSRDMLEAMTKRQLVVMARDRGIEIDTKLSKSIIIDRLIDE